MTLTDTNKDKNDDLKESRQKYSFKKILKEFSLKNTNNTLEEKSFGSLTIKYLPFIFGVVKQRHLKHYPKYSYEELLEVALIASLTAEKRFKPELKWDFSTYARRDIEGALVQYVSSLSKIQLELYNKVLRFISEYSSKTGKHPSKESILKGLKISEEKYNHLLQDLEPPYIVQYTQITEDGTEVELGIDNETPEDSIIVRDILKIISTLDADIKELIELSVIQELSLDAIASYLGIQKSEAQARVDSAKADLKDILELHGIVY